MRKKDPGTTGFSEAVGARKPAVWIGVTRSKINWLVLIFMLYSFSPAKAQETNYAVHANIIYHFTKYIDWPDNKKSGDFIIGIVGETTLYDEIKNSTKGKTAGAQKIVTRQFSSSSSIFNCHILYISADESDHLKKIVTATTDTPTLIVTESEGAAKKGACINFVIVRERLKLEINKNTIEKRGLSIATELLQLGTIVN